MTCQIGPRQTIWLNWLLALTVCFMPSSLKANDCSAELGAGGLVFSINKDIEMLSEDLFVSENEIKVDYKFRNRSDRDITTLVAFPLPDIEAFADTDVDIPSPEAVNFVDFVTLVDDRRVEAEVELKAVAQGADITALLKKLGIALNPRDAKFEHASKSVLDQLRQSDLLDETDNPLWSLKTTFYWQQTFPAGSSIEIKHRYRPIAGGSVATGVHLIPRSSEIESHYKKYCVEPSLIAALTGQIKTDNNRLGVHEGFSETSIKYILKTGANWAGPIRHFRLVVDKGSSRNLVSFCGERVRKIGPSRFEMVVTNFVPTENLSVLVLSPKEVSTVDEAEDRSDGDLEFASCAKLWSARNKIYKDAGYCFKTSKAISSFGNSGCLHDDIDQVALTPKQRKYVSNIKSFEVMKGCQQ